MSVPVVHLAVWCNWDQCVVLELLLLKFSPHCCYKTQVVGYIYWNLVLQRHPKNQKETCRRNTPADAGIVASKGNNSQIVSQQGQKVPNGRVTVDVNDNLPSTSQAASAPLHAQLTSLNVPLTPNISDSVSGTANAAQNAPLNFGHQNIPRDNRNLSNIIHPALIGQHSNQYNLVNFSQQNQMPLNTYAMPGVHDNLSNFSHDTLTAQNYSISELANNAENIGTVNVTLTTDQFKEWMGRRERQATFSNCTVRFNGGFNNTTKFEEFIATILVYKETEMLSDTLALTSLPLLFEGYAAKW